MQTITSDSKQLVQSYIYPLLKIRERVLIWKNQKGSWKNKQTDIDSEKELDSYCAAVTEK